MCGSSGGTMGPDPPPPPPPKKKKKNHINIGFLSNTGPDPLKYHKATDPAFNVRPSLAASEMPFKWRLACWPMMARFYMSLVVSGQLTHWVETKERNCYYLIGYFRSAEPPGYKEL